MISFKIPTNADVKRARAKAESVARQAQDVKSQAQEFAKQAQKAAEQAERISKIAQKPPAPKPQADSVAVREKKAESASELVKKYSIPLIAVGALVGIGIFIWSRK